MKEIIPNWLDNPGLSHVLACRLHTEAAAVTDFLTDFMEQTEFPKE